MSVSVYNKYRCRRSPHKCMIVLWHRGGAGGDPLLEAAGAGAAGGLVHSCETQ